MAAQTAALRSFAVKTSASRSGSQSPGFSRPSSNRSNPIALTLGASSAIDPFVGGETQTQALTPIGFIPLPSPIDEANLETEVALTKDKAVKLKELLPYHQWPEPLEP